MNDGMMKERLVLGERHGFGTTRLDEKLLLAGTRAIGLLSGRDLRAWSDTRRYRGQHADELLAEPPAVG